MDLQGKNIVYIGGSGGIGEKCVEQFLKKNVANLFILDLNLNEELLEKLKIAYPSTNIDYIALDISKFETIESAFKTVMQKVDRMDVLVNGSGILNEKQIELTVAVNLTGLIHSSLIALDYMSKAKGGPGGMIVNISSVTGLEPCAPVAVYSATKFGVTGFTRSLAHPVYYEKTGVKFITICPGGTLTPIIEYSSSKSTFPEYRSLFNDFYDNISYQSAGNFSQRFIEILEIAENGTVWMVESGELKKIECPVMWMGKHF